MGHDSFIWDMTLSVLVRGHDSQCARESQSSSSIYGFRIEAVSGMCELIWDTRHSI